MDANPCSSSPAVQYETESEAGALIRSAEESLHSAYQLLKGDPFIPHHLRILQGAIMILQRHTEDGADVPATAVEIRKMLLENRAAAHGHILIAVKAIREAADKRSRPKAKHDLIAFADELTRLAKEYALQAETVELRKRYAMTPAELKALRKFAGEILGIGHRKKKAEGLVKARAARAEKRRRSKAAGAVSDASSSG